MIDSVCIFALKHHSDLVASEGKPTVEWREGKAWRTAGQLLERSIRSGMLLLVFFADADKWGPVTHYGQLVAVHVVGDTTRYTVAGLRRLPSPIPTDSLIVNSTNRPIPRTDIRSYRICTTPTSLRG